jgi:hypothetical protein
MSMMEKEVKAKRKTRANKLEKRSSSQNLTMIETESNQIAADQNQVEAQQM